MSIRIKLAETPAEYDAALKLRHKVFVEHDQKFSATSDSRLYDRFDCCTTSILFIAIVDNKIVGTARLNLDDKDLGFPADEYFDFRSICPVSSVTASLSQLAVDPDSRGSLKVLNGLMMLTYYWAHLNGISHCVAPFNPALTRVMERIGFQKLGGVVDSLHHNLPIQPMIITLSEIRASFVDFVQRQDLLGFMEPFVREYFEKGETIVKQGEVGDCAYFIVNGDACVQLKTASDTQNKTIASLSRGDLFCELALVLSQPRTASVVASSDLEVMILSRRQFLNCIQTDSKNALYTLELLASRLAATTSIVNDGNLSDQ